MNNNRDQFGTPKVLVFVRYHRCVGVHQMTSGRVHYGMCVFSLQKAPKKSPLRPLSWRKSISQLLHLNWPGSSHGNNNEARDMAPNRESNGVMSTLMVGHTLNRRPSGRRKYANRWTMGLIAHEPQNTLPKNKCST